jgi:hypothetical protein
MSQFPDRPDLDQLRRQAREHGFPSWARLKEEAERRRASAEDAGRAPDTGPAGYLTADADELIEGQYADRRQLRPVLDAVLAVLPAPRLRQALEDSRIGYVVKIPCSFRVTLPTGQKMRADHAARLKATEC